MPLNPWLGVEFRHLAALDAIARTGSFRGAADDLGYVQSAISQQMARLEALVGVRLIDRERGTGPVELTDAGRLMLKHSSAIMERLDAAQADLATVTSGLGGTVRIGSFEALAASLMPSVLRACTSKLQVIHTELLDEAAGFELVANGALDVAFGTLPLDLGPFAFLELAVDPCVLLVHESSSLAAGPPPSAPQLGSLPLVRHERWRMTDLIVAELRAGGTEPSFAFSARTTATVQALVGEGLGAAILPSLSASSSDPRIAAIDLQGLLPRSTIVAYWHRDREVADNLRDFLEITRSVFRRPRGDGITERRPDVALAA
jgi:DNA-binding transcriptional LysR family regulator